MDMTIMAVSGHRSPATGQALTGGRRRNGSEIAATEDGFLAPTKAVYLGNPPATGMSGGGG
jgi:hypothetical protein